MSTHTSQIPKILIVEDNEINRKYLTGIIGKWGVTYDQAIHGQEALELIALNDYDLILLDIRMPVMNGYELTRILRTSENRLYRDIPIVALTASALIDEREKVLESGMNDHLTKPYTPEQIHEVASRYLPFLKKTERDSTASNVFSDNLDQNYLNEFYQGDVERARVLFGLFLQVIDKEVMTLVKHFEEGDWNAFAKQAHKIKPNFAMVGLTDLSQIMKIYEGATYDESVRQKINREIHNLSEKLENGRKIVENELRLISQFQQIA